ncbi:CNNM domain-containing protein [Halobacterium litoreum]|uniref:CNNM domain-containing protein n=1 Tax=Halobacterium litoreum TaxID=2039234 RepID=A0ABD5NH84_9EURY|nr:hemolysin family protein [Halobacterium litoreum]UHH12533.1 hemolysin family protein [Halobacterium litoreum]
MNDLEVALRLVAGVGLILANGFFVAIEFALTRARQFTEDEFVDGNSRLERAWEMTNDLELYLTTCQVGITASSIAVGIVAEPALAAIFEPLFAGTTLATVGAGALIAYFIINLVHLTHGEQTPTYLGVERSRWVCKWGAAPLYWFYVLISPLIKLGDAVAKWTLKLFGVEMTGAWLETEEDVIESRAELRNRLHSVLGQGELSEERREEVLGALDIGRIPVEDIAVDPADVVALSTDDDLETNLERMSTTPHVRYPLVGESMADFRGIVYLPEVFRDLDDLRDGTATLADIAHSPMTIEAGTSVSEAIDRFQAERQELAFVTDGDDVLGLVTVTDALEAIAGEVEDPIDDEN